jgi:pilus assembly protein CpaF
MSLMDRLSGRKSPNGTGAQAPTALPSSPPEGIRPPATPQPAMPIHTGAMPATGSSMRAGSSMYTRGGRDEEKLNAVDQLKVDLHHRLIERLDLEALEQIKDEVEVVHQIRLAVGEFLREESTPLSQAEREEIVEQVVWEITGLGPIEPLFRDPSISDILVNSHRDIFIERKGKLTRVGAQFRNDGHLLAVIDRIVSRIGRRVDESSPMVDARLPDGSRVNAIIPPLALDGPVLSIRRFGADLTVEQLIANGALTMEMLQLLAGCVKARLNVLISGGTGSGKTTLLNALSSFIPADERVVTIEDAAELRLQQEHVVRLETRPPNSEGRGEVLARDLVKNALRMRPDRIIVGEVRGPEALDMLQAMNTGHEGSMTTVHANSPRDALSRIEQMIGMSGIDIPPRSARSQIASAIHTVVQVARLADGRRKLISLSEITGMEGEVVTMQEIFRFRQTGMSPEGQVIGKFEATGIRPRFLDHVMAHGMTLSADLFRPDAKFEA